jgi:hypothetical protein
MNAYLCKIQKISADEKMPEIMFQLTESEVKSSKGAKRFDNAIRAASKAVAENVELSKFGKKKKYFS